MDDFRAVVLYTRVTMLWRLLVLWSNWSNREFHERREGTGTGSRASQGVNYARKQYYRTNYRTGERNSVKCRADGAAHYQPLPRKCTARYKLFRRMANWPDSKGTIVPPSLPPSLPSFFLVFFPPFLPFQFYSTFFHTTRFNPFTADRGRSFDRDFHRPGKNIFPSCILLRAKLNTTCLH